MIRLSLGSVAHAGAFFSIARAPCSTPPAARIGCRAAPLVCDASALHRAEPSYAKSLARSAERQLEVQSLGSLEMVDDLEEIAGLRVAAWTEHAHQALGRPFCSATQLLEPNRRVDIVAE